MPQCHATAPTLLLRYFTVLNSSVMHSDRRARMRNIIPTVCFAHECPECAWQSCLATDMSIFSQLDWPLFPVFFWSSLVHSHPPMTKSMSKTKPSLLSLSELYTWWNQVTFNHCLFPGDQEMTDISSNSWVMGEILFKLHFGKWS